MGMHLCLVLAVANLEVLETYEMHTSCVAAQE